MAMDIDPNYKTTPEPGEAGHPATNIHLRREAMQLAISARREHESLMDTAQEIYDFITLSGNSKAD